MIVTCERDRYGYRVYADNVQIGRVRKENKVWLSRTITVNGYYSITEYGPFITKTEAIQEVVIRNLISALKKG